MIKKAKESENLINFDPYLGTFEIIDTSFLCFIVRLNKWVERMLESEEEQSE